MKRLYIENDHNIDLSRVKSYLRDLYNYKGEPEKFFDEIFTNATFDSLRAWNAVKRNDEIFAESSLIDSMGVSGGMLFNNMMYLAINEKIIGKKVYLFSDYEDIWWDNLKPTLLKDAFEFNELFTLEEEGWKKVDIQLLIQKIS